MKLNVASIKTRSQKLEQYIAELKKQQTLSFEQFERDFTVQLAVERAFQAATECCTDIGNHVISVYGLERPEEQRDVFLILAKTGYLDDEYARQMGEMVSFRNRIVHIYWGIDVRRLYRYLQEDVPLFEKFRNFALQIIEAEGSGD
ncbi:MAG: DUF86 domain-containing protein [Chloroflexota bacterium]